MALVKCPECGRENVSDSAEACPSCGFAIKKHFDQIQQNISTDISIDKKTNKKAKKIITITSVIILIVCVAAYLNYSEKKAYYEEEYTWNCDGFKIQSKTALKIIQSLDWSKEDHYDEIERLSSLKNELNDTYEKIEYYGQKGDIYGYYKYKEIIESLESCISQLQNSDYDKFNEVADEAHWLTVSKGYISIFYKYFPQ
ncbi:MAG: zinc ribbon domain-containing protein [Clostridiaceae bacterium]|nr:zinc ribbon domain-containing protein [Clostridiaceae bacterium]